MSLAAIEAELVQKAQAERRRWQEIAALLMQVEQGRLWAAHTSSFTAWVRGIARRAELEESVFWRCLKAGRIYEELTGNDVRELGSHVSAEALELADKISRHAPERVVSEVLTRTLDGDLSRGELREVWSTYKPAAGGITARGRLPDDEGARAEALTARRALWEAQKQEPKNQREVQRSEIVSAFRSASFLGSFDQAHADSRPQGMARNVSALLVVRKLADAELELHALLSCVSEPELADFSFEPAPGTDFMWLGVPAGLGPRALAVAPRMLGVLELGQGTLGVRRAAMVRPKNAQARLDLLSALLARAYLWP
jgi:hypothetical protein